MLHKREAVGLGVFELSGFAEVVDNPHEPLACSADEQAETLAPLLHTAIGWERLQRERAEAQVNALAWRTANQRMDEFLSIAAHELRTPLTTMKANLQMAARRVRRLIAVAQAAGYGDVTDAASLEEMLNRMADAVDRQNRLVSNLLDVSRIQAGTLELSATLLDLGDLVLGIYQEYQLAYPDRVFELTLPNYPVLVMVDGERIRQVMDSYLTNAMKYSAVEQPIEISVETGMGLMRTGVRDHGPGLSTQERARIWDRFYRVPEIQPLQESSVGLGLGLYIARQIILQHGGAVGLDSAPGEGSTFWFTLTLAAGSPGTEDQNGSRALQLLPASGESKASGGICVARGANRSVPAMS
ncbi:MAG: sensor histidine kinase [Ktedonobacterales bacterium]